MWGKERVRYQHRTETVTNSQTLAWWRDAGSVPWLPPTANKYIPSSQSRGCRWSARWSIICTVSMHSFPRSRTLRWQLTEAFIRSWIVLLGESVESTVDWSCGIILVAQIYSTAEGTKMHCSLISGINLTLEKPWQIQLSLFFYADMRDDPSSTCVWKVDEHVLTGTHCASMMISLIKYSGILSPCSSCTTRI